MKILIVDDDHFALRVVAKTLARLGYTAVLAHDGLEALEILRQGEIRLVITDWDMPRMTGVELCRAVRHEDIAGYVYMIMLTGREGARQRMEGLYAGADDFLNKPLDPEELLICLKQAERILALETRDVTLFALAKLAESRDVETGAHLERVQNYTRVIAKNLSSEVRACHGVDDDYIRLLYQTSPLHDLGKVSIPDAILLKPGKLTSEEREIMKTHAMLGAQTLDTALQRYPNVPYLQMARDIAAMHHEKFDGSGYPQGLVGEQIPLCARIVALADAYDAITSKRVYKEGRPHEEARSIILHDRGSHFDPEVVDAFMRAEKELVAIRARLNEMDEEETPVVVAPAPTAAIPNNGKILLVEDDPFILEHLEHLLVTTGEEILIARDGEAALKLFDEYQPRVVISDWVMPRMDGVELCRELRKRVPADCVHFVMLTAHSDKSRLTEAYEAGVDDFISKPFSNEELLARVRAGIRTAKLHDEMVRKSQGSQALNAQLAALNSRLERLSITDELTGLFNRRQAMSRMEEHWSLAQRYSRPLSVVSLDIDHFKKINDTFGHDAGDEVLKRVALTLRGILRGLDTLCRVGGEEFLIILPSHTLEEARVCAERCRVAVEAARMRSNGSNLSVTISAGIASRLPAMNGFVDLLKVADEALYAAKQGGRNRVCGETCKTDAAAQGDAVRCDAPLVSETTARSITECPVDLDAVLKRCDGDAEFVTSAIDNFCAEAGQEIDRIAQLLKDQDQEKLGRAAHGLKSMAGFIAAEEVAGLARQIEELCRAGRIGEAGPMCTQLHEEVKRTTEWLAKYGNATSVARLANTDVRH